MKCLGQRGMTLLRCLIDATPVCVADTCQPFRQPKGSGAQLGSRLSSARM